jgi:hypothetical protein
VSTQIAEIGEPAGRTPIGESADANLDHRSFTQYEREKAGKHWLSSGMVEAQMGCSTEDNRIREA